MLYDSIVSANDTEVQRPAQWPRYYIPLKDRLPLPGCTLNDAPWYWRGALSDGQGDLEDAVSRGYGVGVLPERSGLVVIDCDVRLVTEETSQSSLVWLRKQTGWDDLKRVATERGERIPKTYAVRTPSGGGHLYFRANPAVTVMSKGHRANWLIDVKASPNTFCVAPPTPGYEVICDALPAALPYWLACHIMKWLPASDAPKVVPGPVSDAELGVILAYVADSNRQGGWNTAIFLATCWLRESGLALDDIIPLVIGAAAPSDDREKGKAMATIRSGWNR